MNETQNYSLIDVMVQLAEINGKLTAYLHMQTEMGADISELHAKSNANAKTIASLEPRVTNLETQTTTSFTRGASLAGLVLSLASVITIVMFNILP